MHTPKSLHYTAVTFKTLFTLAILLFMAAFLQLIIIEMYREFYVDPHFSKNVRELTDEEKQQNDINQSAKEFTADGTLYLVNYNVARPGILGEGMTIVKDSGNNVLFKGKDKENPYSFIPWYSKNQNYSTINQNRLESLNILDGEFTPTHAVPMVNPANKRMGHWFWDNQKRYFKYYGVDGAAGGYIGADGYSDQPRQVKAFGKLVRANYWLKPDSFDPVMLYRSDSAVYQIDFRNRQVETLFDNPNDPVREAALNNWEENEQSEYRPTLAVITKSYKLILFLKNPRQVVETQLADVFHHFNTPSFAAAGDKIWAQMTERTGSPKTDDWDIYFKWIQSVKEKPLDFKIRLFEMDKNGTFAEKNSFSWKGLNPYFENKFTAGEKAFVSAVFSFSSPLPRLIFHHLVVINNNTYRILPAYVRLIADIFVFETVNFNWYVNLSILAVLAILTLLHGRGRQTSVIQLVLWIIFVAAFNLAGFLTYLAYNHTPMLKCAACGKRRGLGQDACCRCGAELPAPQSRDTDLITTLSA